MKVAVEGLLFVGINEYDEGEYVVIHAGKVTRRLTVPRELIEDSVLPKDFLARMVKVDDE